MKKFILFIGVIFLSIVIILNFLFTANLDAKEHVTILGNSLLYVALLVITGIVIFLFTKFINNYLYNGENDEVKKKVRKYLFIAALTIYVSFCVIWTIVVRPAIVGDQGHVCDLAKGIYNGTVKDVLSYNSYAGISIGKYMQAYQQQISASFIYSLFLRIFHFGEGGILRILNVASNIVIIVALYNIIKLLSNDYKVNKVLFLTLILTFFTLPMLSTFVYGDIPSLALCLCAVYFMMRYTKSENLKFAIIASAFTAVAYMLRMNSLIFIIATVIYLVLSLLSKIKKNTFKQNLLSSLIIIMYVVIAIFPSFVVQSYYINKYQLDKTKSYPTISFILIAMEDKRSKGKWLV